MTIDYVSGNVFIREGGPMRAGEVVGGHAHNFDHTTYVTHGSLLIERLVDGAPVQSVTKSAGQEKNWVLIRAGAEHRLTALEDGTIYHCIYSHRNAQGEVVMAHEGWAPAYE